MTPRILVQNRQRRVPIGVADLQSFAERALPMCAKLKPRSPGDLNAHDRIEIVLVSDRRIGQLHRRFLGISGPTDVITFHHGEICISTETAQRQAADLAVATQREIELYLVHGLLHLHGYADDTVNAAAEMARVQERIASQSRSA